MLKRKTYIFIFCVVILFICTPAFAEVLPSNNIDSKNQQEIGQQHVQLKPKEESLNEAQAYKLLYENAKETNGKILDTIYWALGGILAVILFILGTNIYFNFRVNKKEIEDIKNKLYIEMSEKNNIVLQSYKEELNEEFRCFSDNQSLQIKNLKSGFDEKTESIKEIIKALEKDINKTFNETNIRIKKENDEALIELYEVQAKVHSINKNYVTALRSYISKAMVQVELSRNLQCTLGDILEVLNNCEYTPWHSQKEFQIFINKIPDEYLLQKQKIEDAIKNLPIK